MGHLCTGANGKVCQRPNYDMSWAESRITSDKVVICDCNFNVSHVLFVFVIYTIIIVMALIYSRSFVIEFNVFLFLYPLYWYNYKSSTGWPKSCDPNVRADSSEILGT